jgi:hypothetical protein
MLQERVHAASETAPEMARTETLTPLAEWVLKYTCWKPISRPVPVVRLGRIVHRTSDVTCMLFRDHAERGLSACSETWVRG